MLKNLARNVLRTLKWDVTKNLKYDRLTLTILKQELKPESHFIDVGCHKGEILDQVLKYSPKGKHIGFEPIPSYAKALKEKYKNHSNITIYDCALADKKDTASFNYVEDAPAYSGLKKRTYKTQNPKINEIQVTVDTLDNFNLDQVDFIKIDVEGGELNVLKGSRRLLTEQHPILIFEFGKGASEFYNSTPEELHSFLSSLNYKIYSLSSYLSNGEAFTLDSFKSCYDENLEYYFIAKS